MTGVPPRTAILFQHLRAFAFAFATLLATPSLTWACPACYASMGQKVISSYILSAAILTLLPFTMVGVGAAIAMYLRRQARELDRANAVLARAGGDQVV